MKVLKQKIEENLGDLKLKAEELREKAEEHMEDMKDQAEELYGKVCVDKFGNRMTKAVIKTSILSTPLLSLSRLTLSLFCPKAKDQYELVKKDVEDNIEKAVTNFYEAKEKMRVHIEKLREKARELRKTVEGRVEGYVNDLNDTVYDVKETVLGHVETLKVN